MVAITLRCKQILAAPLSDGPRGGSLLHAQSLVRPFGSQLQRVLIYGILFITLATAIPLEKAAHATPHAQPELLALVAQHPEGRVGVIVQKLAKDGSVERLVSQLGGVVTRDLHIINAFAADVPASTIP